ncbi:MAG: FkbM family methyltransferase [Methylobacter sp.]
MRLMVGKNNVPVELFKAYKINTVSIPVPGLTKDVLCRLHKTDPKVFNQIFIREEYKNQFLPKEAKVIIDAGANVGYSVLFFKMLYPAATVIAIEPDPCNFEMLRKNCGYMERVILLNAALWKDCSKLELQFKSNTGNSLGSWGVRTVSATGANDVTLTEAYDVPTLMDKYAIDEIDIFKIDIEGAEKEVFGEVYQAWYDRVRLFILETHEGIVRGSDTNVKLALPSDKWKYAKKGENQFFKNRQI